MHCIYLPLFFFFYPLSFFRPRTDSLVQVIIFGNIKCTFTIARANEGTPPLDVRHHGHVRVLHCL